MKRTSAIILAAVVAAALFGGLVYAVLVAAHVSEPTATTVYGLTPGDSGPPRSLCWHWSAWSSVGWLWPAPPVVSAPLPGGSEASWPWWRG